jgi:hypothetical protein
MIILKKAKKRAFFLHARKIFLYKCKKLFYSSFHGSANSAANNKNGGKQNDTSYSDLSG